ncbi:MAG: glycosyltransferase family 4 protein [Clostridia bacterium]|nr:glycosyltransferase family 4 protein [Clostridia bacterium]
MKVLLYKGDFKDLAKSGIGTAILHQEKILKESGIPYTLDEKDDYDIVHINSVYPKTLLFAKKCKKRGIKVIYYAHSTEEDFKDTFKFSNILSKIYKKWLIKCYKTGDVIITPTEYSQSLIERYGINKKIFVISNGIELSCYDRKKADGMAFRKKYNYTQDDKIIMSVGLFFERKGLLDFIELARIFPQYKFIWFGHLDFKYIPKKISSAIKNKPDNVLFPGFVKSEELRNAYVGSDIFVFLTREETEGIVLLEALALKTPTIINDIPIYKYLEDGKNIYKIKNISECKDKINNIFNGKLKNLTNEGYEVVKDIDLPNISNRLKEVYKYVLDKNNF